MMGKLTDAQIRVLRKLLSVDGRQFLLVGSDINVARNMLKHGYVRYYGHNYFAITAAGRAALSPENGGEE